MSVRLRSPICPVGMVMLLLLITATASRLHQQQQHASHSKVAAADGFNSGRWSRTATASTRRPNRLPGAAGANSSSSAMRQPPAVWHGSSIQDPQSIQKISGPHRTNRRHLQQAGQQAADGNSVVLQQWLQNSTWTRQYAGGSCFPSGSVERAAGIKGQPKLAPTLVPAMQAWVAYALCKLIFHT